MDIIVSHMMRAHLLAIHTLPLSLPLISMRPSLESEQHKGLPLLYWVESPSLLIDSFHCS